MNPFRSTATEICEGHATKHTGTAGADKLEQKAILSNYSYIDHGGLATEHEKNHFACTATQHFAGDMLHTIPLCVARPGDRQAKEKTYRYTDKWGVMLPNTLTS